MSQTSAIEWTNATWNPTTGCTKISPGCANCYIERTPPFRMSDRKFIGGKIPLQLHEDRLDMPLHWKTPKRIFVNSLSDLFHRDVPFEYVDQVVAVMALAHWHTFQLLTKRPERMVEYFATRTAIDDSGRYERAPQWYQCICRWLDEGTGSRHFFPTTREWERAHAAVEGIDVGMLPRNIWLGVSVENKKHGLPRIQHLKKVPAAVRFLSIEPLLEDLGDVRPYLVDGQQPETKIDWAIVGGESGPGARPMHPDWVRGLARQCVAAGVAFFFKQWGEYAPLGDVSGLQRDDYYDEARGVKVQSGDGSMARWMQRVGKKRAGRMLDGREWNEMPKAMVTA